jgi:GT2 family glycosyltransferase
MTITALLTCFNRKEKTLACLRNLEMQDLSKTELKYVVVDDGSTDGTGKVVKQEFPAATLIQGDGSLYWCGGMRRAWRRAAEDDPDYYFLVNDDTLLDSDALQALLEMTGSPDARIIAVAAIRDPITGKRSYGGIRGSGIPVNITGEFEPCDTFNANAVLIPRAVYREQGLFHSAYTHGMGDFDYGYQASRRGIHVLQSQRALGTCQQNGINGTWRDRSLSRYRRLCLLQSPKGLPFKEWVVFNRRNSDWRWPIRSVSPFFRILLGR